MRRDAHAKSVADAVPESDSESDAITHAITHAFAHTKSDTVIFSFAHAVVESDSVPHSFADSESDSVPNTFADTEPNAAAGNPDTGANSISNSISNTAAVSNTPGSDATAGNGRHYRRAHIRRLVGAGDARSAGPKCWEWSRGSQRAKPRVVQTHLDQEAAGIGGLFLYPAYRTIRDRSRFRHQRG